MKRLIITALGLLIGMGVNARETVRLTDGWTVFPVYDVSKNPKKEQVSVPHTWNADDVFSGMKYERGTYVYEHIGLTPHRWRATSTSMVASLAP